MKFGKGSILKAGAPFIAHKKFWDASTSPPYNELQDLTAELMERIRTLLVYDDSNA
jgi:hypothetical protein